ncbi:tumor protein p53-inducible nuclear protein 1 isoform 1-T2 [Pholidichthys leucotaenia]
MLGKFLSHLLGNAGEDLDTVEETHEELLEFEEEDWVVVELPEDVSFSLLNMDSLDTVDPLENLLIEHPSMSVYQMLYRMGGVQEEEQEKEAASNDEEEENSSRSVTTRWLLSWHLGIPVPYDIRLLAGRKAERRKLSRGALRRQNLTKTRFSVAEKRFGHFKQPCQRQYNY